MKPTVPEVRELVSEYYCLPGNAVGGALHIVVDDGNIEDSHVQFCRNEALARGDAAGVRIADLLLQMSKTQRKKVADTHKGYERQNARGTWNGVPIQRAD